MRFSTVALMPLLLATSLRERPRVAERIVTNDNRVAAGRLANGVLTIRLEAREGEWRPDRNDGPGVVVRAFAEAGKALSVPGPLIRVREGTEIHAFVRNSLGAGTLILRGLSTRGPGAVAGSDTIQIASGSTREVQFVAGTPGTYFYSGTAGNPDDALNAELNGGFVIDPRDAPSAPRDRIFLIGLWRPTNRGGAPLDRTEPVRFTINGKSWPNTERLTYAVGDTVRFRVVNVSAAVHPMHLHGFYFNVDSRGDRGTDSLFDARRTPRRVVTERLGTERTFSMTWVPERAGNWLFHCHDNYHVLRNTPLDGSGLPAEQLLHPMNHAVEMMGGLVMGIEVRGRPGADVVTQGAARRKLRLIARVDTGGTESEPAYGYELQDGTSLTRPLRPAPTIVLTRGEPVSITVVNRLPEATAVHWHGIELESYYDGVADFSGQGARIAHAIAPGDSFVAHFTPPRSGTFMYHPHADEVRQQQAGLAGAIVVVDAPASFDAVHDRLLVITVPRTEAEGRASVLINGSTTPPPLELRAGERYRVRIVNLHTFRPSMIARLMRDSSVVTWRPVAKDGMDLPADQAMPRTATQQLGNGEAYDFEVMVPTPGDLRFNVSAAAGPLLATMAVRVR